MDTTVSSGNQIERWSDDDFYEYVRANQFARYMGRSENAIIQTNEDLSKEAGDKITFQLIGRLTGSAVTGDDTLEGNEEQLDIYSHKVEIDQERNAVRIGRMEQQKTSVDVPMAARRMLKLWNMSNMRDLFINRLVCANVNGTQLYADTTEGDRDTWAAAQHAAATNTRVLYGAAIGNEQSGDHSSSVSQIDGTNDDLHQDIVSLMRRLAMTCDPHIRPVVSQQDGRERFVLFAGSLPFRDLRANLDTQLQNADVRGDKNKLIAGGDIVWENVIVHEVPEMPVLTDVGDSGTTEVGQIALCGAQALLLAWGMRMRYDTDDFDYKNKKGVAVAEIRGCEKPHYQSNQQHGVVSGYVSAVGD